MKQRVAYAGCVASPRCESRPSNQRYDSPPVAPNEAAWNPISPGCNSLAVSGRIRSLYACTKDKDRMALFFDARVRLGAH